jgi:hypothetical protein
MEVVEYIYIYSIDSHQCINDDHFNSQVGIYNFYIDQFITIAIIATTLLHDRFIALIGTFVSIKFDLTTPFFVLKCLYQAQKVGGHVYVC